MKPRVVPRDAAGFVFSLIPGGPKWTILCGNCPATFRARIGHVDNPSVRCPYCGTWNELRGITWGTG